jgi:DNA-binding MarR family transcriptional regulator
MAATTPFAKATALEVRDECLCFAAQRAARELARRFDRLFLNLGLTNGQFSMMVAIGGMGEPKLGQLAAFLAMDHATVTAAIRTLEKRELVTLHADDTDRRARRVSITGSGSALIAKAVPLWRKEHDRLDAEFATGETKTIRSQMMRLAPPLRRPAVI